MRGGFPGSARADELLVRHHEPGRYVLAHWRNVLLFYWRVAGTPLAVELLERGLMQLSSDYGAGLSMVHLIKEGAGLPDAEVRKGLVRVVGQHQEAIGCISITMMGAGFWASALQSAITGLTMLAPPRAYALRFSRRPDELRTWFSHEHQVRTGERIESERLLHVVDELLRIGDDAAPTISESPY